MKTRDQIRSEITALDAERRRTNGEFLRRANDLRAELEQAPEALPEAALATPPLIDPARRSQQERAALVAPHADDFGLNPIAPQDSEPPAPDTQPAPEPAPGPIPQLNPELPSIDDYDTPEEMLEHLARSEELLPEVTKPRMVTWFRLARQLAYTWIHQRGAAEATAPTDASAAGNQPSDPATSEDSKTR